MRDGGGGCLVQFADDVGGLLPRRLRTRAHQPPGGARRGPSPPSKRRCSSPHGTRGALRLSDSRIRPAWPRCRRGRLPPRPRCRWRRRPPHRERQQPAVRGDRGTGEGVHAQQRPGLGAHGARRGRRVGVPAVEERAVVAGDGQAGQSPEAPSMLPSAAACTMAASTEAGTRSSRERPLASDSVAATCRPRRRSGPG